jgi:hypothetical protein
MKTITIIGDSLSMVRPEGDIFFQDTYHFKLQELLYPEYYIILNSRRGNNVVQESSGNNLYNDVLYNRSSFVVLHLGIVDCAPRIFSIFEQRILDFCLRLPVAQAPANRIIQLKSRYRHFFTKHFPKTYVAREEFEKKYRTILGRIEDVAVPQHIHMINIADTTEQNKAKSFNYEKNIIDYNEIMNKLAAENGRTRSVIDFYSATKKNAGYMLADGIHPSKSGHAYLARALFEKISDPLRTA